MEAKDKKDSIQLGKRTFSQTTTEIKKKAKEKELVKSEDEKFGSDYEVGDCLMSVKGNDLEENYQSSDDQDQLDIIEEQINKKISCIKEMKQLNQVQQLSDD